jgi:hypothetical protein
MKMTADETRLLLDIIQLIATVIIAIYVWQSNKHKATTQAIDRLDLRVDTISDRVLQAESAINHMPDHQALGRVHRRIDEVGQGLSRIEGETKAMHHTLQLMQQHLMDKD